MSPTSYQVVVAVFTSPWLYIGIGLGVPLVWWIAGRISSPSSHSFTNLQDWWRRQTEVWAVRARLWFHARVSILLAAALVLFAPLSWRTAPGLLGNLFILDTPFQFLVVAVMSMTTSLMVLGTFRVVELNAQERFADFNDAMTKVIGQDCPNPPDAWSGRRLWLVFALALPIPVSCFWHTYFLQPPFSWLDVLYSLFCTLGGLFIAWAACFFAVLFETFFWRNKDPNPKAPDVLPFEALPWFRRRRERALKSEKKPDSPLARFLDACFGPGYATVEAMEPERAWVRSGHRQNMLCGSAVLGIYIISYLYGRVLKTVLVKILDLESNPPSIFPPVFYMLLLLLVLGFVLHTLSFYLDRYRVPTILFVGVVSYLLFTRNNTDHYYELNPDAAATSSIWELFWWSVVICAVVLAFLVARAFGKTLSPKYSQPRTVALRLWWVIFVAVPLALLLAVLEQPKTTSSLTNPVAALPLESVFEGPGWKFGGKAASADKGRTLVVVTAEGGGIQASAWTTQVLTGLHERYGKDFTHSIGLISGVSGGGVGAMYFLANWKSGDDPLPGDACKHINEMSQEPCLGASAWGMAFPDFLRFGMPMVIPEDVDRGWALEENWRRNLRKFGDDEVKKRADDWRLSDLKASAAAGLAPVPVFNATLVESGQRLLISPVRKSVEPVPPDKSTAALEKSSAMADKTAPVEFLRLFDDEANNLRVSTAARLSAGFAYVSPVCCAHRTRGNDLTDPVELLKNSHVVDGGYVDNEGVFTVVDWVHFLMRQYARKRGAERPFDRIVIIRIRSFPPWYSASSPGVNGWTDEFWGPIIALQSVRVASQAERNTKVLELLRDADYLPTDKFADLFVARKGQWPSIHSVKEAGEWINKSVELVESIGPSVEPLIESKDPFYLPLDTIEFSFSPMIDGVPPQPDKNYVTPLSWSLTTQQKDHIGKAWKDLCQNKTAPDKDKKHPLEKLDCFFERKP